MAAEPTKEQKLDVEQGISAIAVGSFISQGGFKKAFEAKLADSSDVAYVEYLNHDHRASFDREVAVLTELSGHENVPKFYGVVEFGEGVKRLAYIQELCPSDLQAEVVKDRLTIEEKRMIMKKLVYGVRHIHQGNLLHRDLKPANILLGVNNSPKINDFGLSATMKESSTEKNKGTLPYMAPEMISPRPDVSDKSDVWSLGCIGLFVFTRSHPFSAMGELKNYMKNPNFLPSEIRLITSDIDRQFISQCLQIDPAKRAGLDDLCNWARLNYVDAAVTSGSIAPAIIASATGVKCVAQDVVAEHKDSVASSTTAQKDSKSSPNKSLAGSKENVAVELAADEVAMARLAAADDVQAKAMASLKLK